MLIKRLEIVHLLYHKSPQRSSITISQLLNDTETNQEYDILKILKSCCETKSFKTKHPRRKKSQCYRKWTGAEHLRFLVGKIFYGESWSKYNKLLPHRDPHAIQSHAQKVYFFIHQITHKYKLKNESIQRIRRSVNDYSLEFFMRHLRYNTWVIRSLKEMDPGLDEGMHLVIFIDSQSFEFA